MMNMLAILVYIGCTTDAAHTNGLQVISVDPDTGKLMRRREYVADNPIYLAWGKEDNWLYANRNDGLVSFLADGDRLKKVDAVSLGAKCACHISVSPDGKRVYWAGYSNGTAGSVEIDQGRFGTSTTYRHFGKGPHKTRQEAAHPHCAVPTPDGKSFCVVDLGLDTLTTYPAGVSFSTKPAGAGPRHLLFHPNGKLAFVVFELQNRLASYEWNRKQGFVRELDNVLTLSSGSTGRGCDRDLAAAIRFSPDGKRVIMSNRGEQSLVVYDYDVKTGKLAFKARTLLKGSWPRDFIFIGDSLALVTMERSGTVLSLRYDATTGEFTQLDELGGFFKPVTALAAR